MTLVQVVAIGVARIEKRVRLCLQTLEKMER